MTRRSLNGTEFAEMIRIGADRLAQSAEYINALNVFPVPDGDTGTNMNLTMSAGIAELNHKPHVEAGKVAEALSKGLLMGARGNSGVILSQLFRGFARAIVHESELTVPAFAAGLQQGVDTAYKAVVKPVEGTILTVAKEAARYGVSISRSTSDLTEWMREVHEKALETLSRTPDMLPVLKQVGVVDSGGQGLVCIYGGFVDYLSGTSADIAVSMHADALGAPVRPSTAQSKLATDSIVFPYDMEFFIQRKSGSSAYSEQQFRRQLERDGDSIILIEDDDLIKVHVHSRRPGDVMNAAIAYGEIIQIHILNMREQHRDIVEEKQHASDETTAPYVDYSLPGIVDLPPMTASPETTPNPDAHELASYGVVAVSVGDGNAELFKSLGVDVVISGGQSMNPSTEDLLAAIQSLSAHRIFVLPNNPNIAMAAKQAAELSERPVTVIETKTIPQGLAAMLAFQESDAEAVNTGRMQKAIERVVTGQITRAVRDTEMDGIAIHEGDNIGIMDKQIVAAAQSRTEAAQQLIDALLASGGDMLTVLTGEGEVEDETCELTEWLAEHYPDVEVEIHAGGQPLYPYLFAVES